MLGGSRGVRGLGDSGIEHGTANRSTCLRLTMKRLPQVYRLDTGAGGPPSTNCPPRSP